MTAIIEITGLAKSFDDKAALRGIELMVGPGERVALVGHNGSGKTTLIRCLLGLHGYAGRIRVDGLDVRTERREVLARVGFVPQTPPALRMSVAECLAFARSVCGVEPDAVSAVAARLGLNLDECRRRPFKKLSGGMKQKLLVALALARRPALLVLDEPTANLDPAARAAFFELLAELPPSTSLLLSSHRVDELAGLVTRLVELDAGLVAKDEVVTTAGLSALDAKIRCEVRLVEALVPVVRGLVAWGLSAGADRLCWSGSIGAPDRFRLLADLARWSGAIGRLSLEDETEHRNRRALS